LTGLDELVSAWGEGRPVWIGLVLALLLGLRHAADPDHLVAVSTLVATETRRPARAAWGLGLAWGTGHATTIVLLGAPVVLAGSQLPEPVQAGAEALVGILVMALALRLLVLWRRGGFHVHEHAHGGVVHRHVHAHGRPHAGHEHSHATPRSQKQAFGVGLAHGVAGSAAAAVLLLATIEGRAEALAALALFAAGTALSMATLSLGFGYALGRRRLRRRLAALAPALGTASFAFGAWYLIGAVGT
jgi:cytochrome c biogenesis protein CcdA